MTATVQRPGVSGEHGQILAKTASILLVLLIAGVGCDQHRGSAEYQPAYGTEPAGMETNRQYSLGVVPLHNSVRLSELFQPLIAILNSRATGFTMRLESSRDFGHHEEKMRSHTLDLAVVNPFQAVTAERFGYRIFAKLKDDDYFHGIIIVRKDADIEKVDDLRGKVICFPAPTALAATLMTKEFLIRRGLNVETEAKPQYVGSQDSVVMSVYRGLAAAGGTWPVTWNAFRRERPEVSEALEIRWRTPPLPNMAVVVYQTVPEADLAAVAAALFGLHESESGRTILRGIGVTGFEPADSETYEPVRQFLQGYARYFGKVPEMEGGGK